MSISFFSSDSFLSLFFSRIIYRSLSRHSILFLTAKFSLRIYSSAYFLDLMIGLSPDYFSIRYASLKQNSLSDSFFLAFLISSSFTVCSSIFFLCFSSFIYSLSIVYSLLKQFRFSCSDIFS